MDAELRETLSEWIFAPLTLQIALVVVGVIAILVAMVVMRRGLTRYVSDNTTRYQARKGITFLGWLAAAVFVALVFSDRLGGFTVAFGVAGAGVAFALQEVIASVAGWVAVSFGGFYKVGDRVQLGGIRGDVIDIGVLRTTLMQIGEWVDGDLYNGRIVRVANSFVFKEPVFNYSGEFPFLWDELVVPIKYGSDHAEARELVERVAREVVGDYARQAEEAWRPITRRYVVEPAGVQPMVTMTANENWIELTLRYVVDYKARRSTQDRLFRRLLEEIDRVPERVGIAAASLNIDKLAPLEVRWKGEAPPAR